MSLLMRAPAFTSKKADSVISVNLTWLNISNVALSNNNRTATCLSTFGAARTTPNSTGLVYAEISMVRSDVGQNRLTFFTSAGSQIATVVHDGNTGTTQVFSFSHNESTGVWKLKRNNTVISSSSNTPGGIYIEWQGGYYGTQGVATINTGQAAFIYTPEYV